MPGKIVKGAKCHLGIGGLRIPAEILGVRDQIYRVKCGQSGVPLDGSGFIMEFENGACRPVYYVRVLTAAPGDIPELVLLRSANLERREMRIGLRVPAQSGITIKGKTDFGPFNATLINMSIGGACIETSAPLHKGSQLSLSLHLNGGTPIETESMVVHGYIGESDRAGRYGIQFRGMAPEDVKAVTWYVWSRVEAFFESQ